MGMRDQMDRQYAPSWKPEPGDEIQGIVVAIDGNTDKWGNQYPIYTVRRISGPDGAQILTDEEVAVHCAATALRNWANEQVPEIAKGDHLGVVYEGSKPKKEGAGSFYSYKKGLIRAADVDAHLRITEGATVPAAAVPADDEPF